MINSLLTGIFNVIIALVNLILYPIDLGINAALPSLSAGLDKVAAFFQWVCDLVPWGISWFGFDGTTIMLFVSYITFELTVPFTIHAVKLAIKWYDKLKP